MKIFSGSSNRPLSKKIAQQLGTKLAPLEIFTFPDGERRVRVEDPVLDDHVILVQATATPVDQNYMELFFMADAAKRSGAKHITAIIPYLGYQRQDHVFRDGEAVSLEVIVKTLETVGINKVIAFDFHSIKIPEVFHIPVSHLTALSLFSKEIKKRGWLNANSVLVSPDTGGIRRIKVLSELLNNMPYVTVAKSRDLATGLVSAISFTGKIAKKAIIVDDMISSGNTMVKAAELLLKNGAKEVYVFGTHPIFSAQAPKILQDSLIREVVVTDTVYIPMDKYFPKLTLLTVSKIIAEEIKANWNQQNNFI